jgi:hypothetical protein
VRDDDRSSARPPPRLARRLGSARFRGRARRGPRCTSPG